jgi:hypothetical protein
VVLYSRRKVAAHAEQEDVARIAPAPVKIDHLGDCATFRRPPGMRAWWTIRLPRTRAHRSNGMSIDRHHHHRLEARERVARRVRVMVGMLPSWPVFIACSMSSASAPRTRPRDRSGRIRGCEAAGGWSSPPFLDVLGTVPEGDDVRVVDLVLGRP